jgi:UDP-N-acetylmuramate--alanine ligase
MNKSIHFIGIGGIGMSGLAKVLAQNGCQITGLDQKESPLTKELESLGVIISYGDDPDFLPVSNAWVVYSSAITADHPHFKKLKSQGYHLLHRSELLQEIAKDKTFIAISGTHGKTSISSLLSYVMCQLDVETSFSIGGILQQFETNARLKEGKYFVAEADESDGSFLNYKPTFAVLSNLETEHMTHYGEEKELNKAFCDFANSVPEPSQLLWCADCSNLRALKLEGVSYGFEEGSDIFLSNYQQNGWELSLDLKVKNKNIKGIKAHLIGKHQAQNVGVVFALCLSLGFDECLIKKAVQSYIGVRRRSEICLEKKYLTVIDDYGHHPTEIAATLKAIEQVYFDKRIIAVFQPHRYSRLKYSYEEFCIAFEYADEVLVSDVYAAGEEKDPSINLDDLALSIEKKSLCSCSYVETENLIRDLKNKVVVDDVLVFFGAGSITKYAHQAAAYFENFPLKKIHVGLICGGESPEHEVSLISSKSIFENLDRDLYEVSVLAVSKTGLWSVSDGMPEGDFVDESKCKPFFKVAEELDQCDVLFPMIHGQNGEDGSLQGFLEFLNKAYVGCDFRASSLCMDKAKTKHIAKSYGFNTANWMDFRAREWKENKKGILRDIVQNFSFPLFVKPCHLGSSIGISCCEKEEGLIEAIDIAFEFDYKILIEEKVFGREIEFAVLGNDQCFAPAPGEILTNGEFYDYEKKYGDSPFSTIPKADISPDIVSEIQEIVLSIYRKIGCRGLSRIDGFLDKNGKFILNEINPLPGFTSISLFPQIWKLNGLSYPRLLSRLIALGRKRKRDESDLLVKKVREIKKDEQKKPKLVTT